MLVRLAAEYYVVHFLAQGLDDAFVQRPAVQLRRVLLDIDAARKVAGVFKGIVLLFAEVAAWMDTTCNAFML
jgi:hypothetical protein